MTGWVWSPHLYANVDTKTHDAPWAYLQGYLSKKGTREISITVNGVASITSSYDDSAAEGAGLVAVLPPSLFHDGNNEIRLYAIAGTPEAPRLETITPGT